MKPIDLTSNSYAEYNEESNEKDTKFKVGDHVRIWKYKNIFAKGDTANWSEKAFVFSKIKKVINWTLIRKNMIVVLIVGLIKKTLYKNDSILS